MRALKRFFPLVVSIAVVVAVALVGLLQSARANATAQQIRRDDRVSEERDLASLTNQYVMFARSRSEEHTSELQSRRDLVCRLLLEKKKKIKKKKKKKQKETTQTH